MEYLQGELHEKVGLGSFERAVDHVPHFNGFRFFDQMRLGLGLADFL